MRLVLPGMEISLTMQSKLPPFPCQSSFGGQPMSIFVISSNKKYSDAGNLRKIEYLGQNFGQ